MPNSPSVNQLSKREDLTTRRLRVIVQRYGEEKHKEQVLLLAYHAAFPLTLTSDLLYCLRETFVKDCPWYAVADILLSGLCETIGYDLYEMEAETRNALLRCLEEKLGKQRLRELDNFMFQYISNRLDQKDNDYRWTPLTYLIADDEKFDTLKRKLRKLILSLSKEDIEWRKLSEKYDDFLQERGFKPLLSKDELHPLDEEEQKIAAALGVELKPFEYYVAVITDDELEELKPFQFATVTVDTHGQIIKREKKEAFFFTEYLGETPGKPAALGIEMVAIPGGSFIMGAPENEQGHRDNESPQHKVTVQPFFIGKYPITQAQWKFVAQLPQINRELKLDPSEFKGDNRPVECVSWNSAVEFCSRLSEYTGRTYTLPSEAEWEYACRAGTTTPFHFGETITSELASYNGSETYANAPKGKSRRKTTPVGSFRVANAFGLYDMHGNVWEWCLDDWHNSYEGAPNDGSAWLDDKNDNSSQAHRYTVARGGSWYTEAQYIRSAYRDFNDGSERVNYFDDVVGFRVVCGVGRILQ
ncbi:hypothetical protein DSM106972_026970 [Dulcicalothrix desertica PCC 7102]|uniref:Sulfatase-modifying factor enzyme-like domain-containing protein n=1 Tax=Dulcicalothrix desertica PCC 7102 TaxID=232991 RepID=A0A3S1CLZ9_9CYAN|nr:formylglycine-generating enzyme family protein [Dulcicalothrix desertica]RUT06440.1 hypothetical protein DSM106972_026970 [Dulcicalothrix desertica PCC 7102]TWH50416.1 formylglycine-generating enzyme required for sulfatase activity [Dulcicalothrix desertica PCC 7102]